MIKVDEIEFTRPVGGFWTLTTLAADTRGQQYACERSDDGAVFFVWRRDAADRRISVPRHSVLWWHDVVGAGKAGK